MFTRQRRGSGVWRAERTACAKVLRRRAYRSHPSGWWPAPCSNIHAATLESGKEEAGEQHAMIKASSRKQRRNGGCHDSRPPTPPWLDRWFPSQCWAPASPRLYKPQVGAVLDTILFYLPDLILPTPTHLSFLNRSIHSFVQGTIIAHLSS